MTLRNQFSVRTLTLSLLLAAPLVGIGCWEPKLKDAEIGCGVDANASPKCPNRPPAEAGPPSPDGLGDGGVAAEAGGPMIDTASTIPDAGPGKPDTAPIAPDTAVDRPLEPDSANLPVDTAVDRASAADRLDTPLADSAADSPAGTGADLGSDSVPGNDTALD